MPGLARFALCHFQWDKALTRQPVCFLNSTPFESRLDLELVEINTSFFSHYRDTPSFKGLNRFS